LAPSDRHAEITGQPQNGDQVRYTYDAAGIKLRKEFDPAVGSTITYDYVAGFHYKNTNLEFVTTAAGRYVLGTDNRFEYHLKDHLGNVRATVYDDDGNVGVVSADDYYPFGLTFNAYVEDDDPNQDYKFQGQEYQQETGWFFNVDPLAEDYVYNSPYTFSENRVIDAIELEGLESFDFRLISKNENGEVESYPFLINASGQFIESRKTKLLHSSTFRKDGRTTTVLAFRAQVGTKDYHGLLPATSGNQSEFEVEVIINTEDKAKLHNGKMVSGDVSINVTAIPGEDTEEVGAKIRGDMSPVDSGKYNKVNESSSGDKIVTMQDEFKFLWFGNLSSKTPPNYE